MLTPAVRRVLTSSRLALVRPQTARTFSAFGYRASGHDVDNPVVIQGPGAKPGSVPTDLDQSAGLERAERLAQLEGREFFQMKPIPMTHMGTRKNPIIIDSVDENRIVGCSGYPAESHDMLWINVERSHEVDRCNKCGCVFKMNYLGE
ncbi:Cytochrome c oxidase subunit 4 [Dimargaris cristalligena]|uniref:Putative COX4-cytochrome-c oxidase chain IV n=1 Tax=Dimargaris cristalligena TaxID=215637 RepID=A0A4P9ZXJ1_9FUNG|nr:Cytochrome c oxidase subunit 4 [Dimargaris cristalligena]RKP38376.1 putative COX4-cytochrome-c oxidase chain IV [Dimargaris cristalligena]|eukprot:RKP38376.1 putative COX4-cytochrome-c oxidase chain IV [Dimargaris cristalligena]